MRCKLWNQTRLLYVWCFVFTCYAVDVSQAQLQITEVLYDSSSTPENNWEWFELYNAGAEDVDLDGYFLDDFSTAGARSEPNILAQISDEVVINTTVPAGKAAIVYNAAGLEFDESRFRAAWNLPTSVPLIGVDGWQALNQGGDAIGLWSDVDQYNADLQNVDDDEALEVASLANAVVSLDYRESFPATGAGASMEWTGTGDIAAGENWIAHDADGNVTTSVATFLNDVPINDPSDIGSPGVLTGDVAETSAFMITELMYNPVSDEPDWEWIEVYNGTSNVIDFEQSPHFLDDAGGNAMSEPNLTIGQIPAGEVAVLFRSGITVNDMTTAWGEANYIAVERWPAMNNGGDLIGIWDDVDTYMADSLGDARVDNNAVAYVNYLDGDEDWPNVGQGNSIQLVSGADSNLGANWALSSEDDGISKFATAIIASLPDHAGGDVGTPGVFGDNVVVTPTFDIDINSDGNVDAADAALVCASVSEFGITLTDALATGGYLPGDVDLNGTIEFADFLTLSGNFGTSAAHYGQGDTNCDQTVDFSDFLALSGNFGKTSGTSAAASVPESTALTSALLSVLGLLVFRRRRPQ